MLSPPIPTLDDLLCLADAARITIRYHDLNSHPEITAWAQGRTIILDRSLLSNYREHKCILAEEIGHVLLPPLQSHAPYYKKTFATLDFKRRSLLTYQVSKDEFRARAWAANFLIPEAAFSDHIARGPHTITDWCDYFEVSDWLMLFRFHIATTKAPSRLQPAFLRQQISDNQIYLQRGEPIW